MGDKPYVYFLHVKVACDGEKKLEATQAFYKRMESDVPCSKLPKYRWMRTGTNDFYQCDFIGTRNDVITSTTKWFEKIKRAIETKYKTNVRISMHFFERFEYAPRDGAVCLGD